MLGLLLGHPAPPAPSQPAERPAGGPAFNFPWSSRARPRRSPAGRGVGTAPSPPARGEGGGRGRRPLPAHTRPPPAPARGCFPPTAAGDGVRAAPPPPLPPPPLSGRWGERPFTAARLRCGLGRQFQLRLLLRGLPKGGRFGTPTPPAIYICVCIYI